VKAQVVDFDLKEFFSQDIQTDVDADQAKRVMIVPPFPPEPVATVYFVKLLLHDQAGKELSSNFYWLPAKLSTLDWKKTPDTAFTPIATFEDLTALNGLRQVKLDVTTKVEKSIRADLVRVTLHNPSSDLAFQVHSGIRKANSEEEILPVLWADNYLTLMPGETRVITAQYLKIGVLGKSATLRVDGWNIEPVTMALSTGSLN
jgi:exo-1,4-beta-D-glucosaminidase